MIFLLQYVCLNIIYFVSIRNTKRLFMSSRIYMNTSVSIIRSVFLRNINVIRKCRLIKLTHNDICTSGINIGNGEIFHMTYHSYVISNHMYIRTKSLNGINFWICRDWL